MKTFGFLGCGQMGGALLEGLLASGMFPPERVLVADPVTGEALAARYGVRAVLPAALLAEADEVLLAVKPQVVRAILGELRFRPEQVVFSVVAGLSHAALAALCEPARVVRTMPNVAARVGEGVTLVLGAHTAPDDVARAVTLFEQVGSAVVLEKESLFHAGTALSGAGPAYFFMMFEALADGGVAAGLPRELAVKLAVATARGAAALADEGAHPAALKDAVCSPGGVTIQGVRALERHGLRSALLEAVLAADARSREMEASS